MNVQVAREAVEPLDASLGDLEPTDGFMLGGAYLAVMACPRVFAGFGVPEQVTCIRLDTCHVYVLPVDTRVRRCRMRVVVEEGER